MGSWIASPPPCSEFETGLDVTAELLVGRGGKVAEFMLSPRMEDVAGWQVGPWNKCTGAGVQE